VPLLGFAESCSDRTLLVLELKVVVVDVTSSSDIILLGPAAAPEELMEGLGSVADEP